MPVDQTPIVAPVIGDSGATYHAKVVTMRDRLSELQSFAYMTTAAKTMHVSLGANASNSNDGLSWGSPKATVDAAAKALGGPGTVLIGGGDHTITSPLPNTSGITYRGTNLYGTKITASGCSFLVPSTDLRHITFEGLKLYGGSHLFDLSTGGLCFCTFRDCWFNTTGDAVSIFKVRGTAQFLENYFVGCNMYRLATATVPAFDIIDGAAACNGNTWIHCMAHSQNATGTPFFYLDTSLASNYIYDNAWIHVVGEQNVGGFIHLYSPNGCVIEDCHDYDVTDTYADHIFLHGKNAGGVPQNNRISGFGPIGNGVMASGKYFFSAVASTGLVVERPNRHNGSPTSAVSLALSYDRVVSDSGSVILSLRNIGSTTPYVLSQRDGVVIANGSATTISLPDPATVIPGRQFTCKNLHVNNLTVNSAGTDKTIDGAASVAVAQWGVLRAVTDGTQWYVI